MTICVPVCVSRHMSTIIGGSLTVRRLEIGGSPSMSSSPLSCGDSISQGLGHNLSLSTLSSGVSFSLLSTHSCKLGARGALHGIRLPSASTFTYCRPSRRCSRLTALTYGHVDDAEEPHSRTRRVKLSGSISSRHVGHVVFRLSHGRRQLVWKR